MDILIKFLKIQNLTISVAESCTGGLLSNYLSNTAGSSSFFKGGIIAYSHEVKTKLLGVPKEIEVVSRKCAVIMNVGLKKIFNTDICVSVTGNLPPFEDARDIGEVYFSISYLAIDYGFMVPITHMERSVAKQVIISEIIEKIYKTIHTTPFLFEYL